MAIQIKKAQRSLAKLKIGISGPSGSGKTLSSLLLGYGLVKASHPELSEDALWEKLCVIDTENESGSLYVGKQIAGTTVGEYLTINLDAPYSAARYLEAIDLAEQAGVEFLVIDSLSHAWTELVDQTMKAHCANMTREEKEAVAARPKQITGGTANYRAVTDEAILKKIYEAFKAETEG